MQNNSVEIYQSANGETQISVKFEQESVWLSQSQMAILFDTTSENIGMHLKNIFIEQELREEATTKNFLVVRRRKLIENRNANIIMALALPTFLLLVSLFFWIKDLIK